MDEVSKQLEVTVVIPTCNRCRLLQRTLSSVLAQTEVRFEVIVGGDGSSDGTSESLSSLGDPAVVMLRHEAPRGVSAARNAWLTIARASGSPLLTTMDLWAPDKLRAQLTQLGVSPMRTGWQWVR